MTGDCHAGICGSRGLRCPRPPDSDISSHATTSSGRGCPICRAGRSLQPTPYVALRKPAALPADPLRLQLAGWADGTRHPRHDLYFGFARMRNLPVIAPACLSAL